MCRPAALVFALSSTAAVTFSSLGMFAAEMPVTPQPRLRLQVVCTLPEPVIGKTTPGAERIPGGFEGGTSVKVTIDGKAQYHFFAHCYPTAGWGRSQLDHWVSEDGVKFRHAGVMLADYEDQATRQKHIFTAPLPFFQNSPKQGPNFRFGPVELAPFTRPAAFNR